MKPAEIKLFQQPGSPAPPAGKGRFSMHLQARLESCPTMSNQTQTPAHSFPHPSCPAPGLLHMDSSRHPGAQRSRLSESPCSAACQVPKNRDTESPHRAVQIYSVPAGPHPPRRVVLGGATMEKSPPSLFRWTTEVRNKRVKEKGRGKSEIRQTWTTNRRGQVHSTFHLNTNL